MESGRRNRARSTDSDVTAALAQAHAAYSQQLPSGQILVPGQLLKRKLPGRNATCPCGSGRKFKNCCIAKTRPSKPRHRPVSARPKEKPYIAGATIVEIEDATAAQAVAAQEAPSSRQQTAQAMLRVGVDERIVWAYLETGLYITDANKAVQPPAVLERWEVACKAYDDATPEERQILAVPVTQQQPSEE